MSIELLNIFIGSAAALITLVTGALVWWQTSQHFRHSRSASYIERFNTEEYFSARMTVDRFAAQDPNFEAIIRAEAGKESEELERARLHVLMFANIFQEIGAAYRVKLVDRHYTWSVFGFLAQYYWGRLSPFVLRLRAIRNRYELYRDFELLAAAMASLDEKYAKYKDDAFRPPSSAAQIYVFAYGSLMDPDSARKTIPSIPASPQWQAARLYGFERGWFASQSVKLKSKAESANLAFLALRKSHESLCNGVLIPVTKSDLEKLDIREKGYQRVDVTPLVYPSPNGQVFTYTIDPKTLPSRNSLISAKYSASVEKAASALGEDFLKQYRSTTSSAPFDTTTDDYQFADPEQNRAAGRD